MKISLPYLRTISLLLLVFFSCTAMARDYRMSGLDVTIHLQTDGSMQVQENREFSFDGRFSEVYRTFPLDGKASFSNFSVYEDERAYEQNDTGQPGTFRIFEKSNEVELQLFFEARDITRTFSIRYTAEGAVEGFADAALLYYQIISDEWTKPISDIHARIIPPEPLPAGKPEHWVHGSLEAVSAIARDGIVEIELERLPANSYLEIRALYPTASFHRLPAADTYIRESVLEETALLAEEANRMREETLEQQARQAEREIRREERYSKGKQVAAIVSLLYIMLWLWLFKKYRKKPVLSQKPGTFAMLPDKEKPALVNYLMNGTYIANNALVSTMFHLAYRGFFKIEEKTSTKNILGIKKDFSDTFFIADRQFWQENREQLSDYEQMLLSLLFDELTGRTDRIRLKTISRKQHKMQRFYRKWKKALNADAEKKGWFDENSKKGRSIGLAVSIVSLLGMIALVVLFGPWLLIPAMLSFISILASLAILQRTEKGEIAYLQWKSLKKHLKKYHFESRIKELDADNLNEYLIYGMALGLGPRYLKRLTRALEDSGQIAYFPWIVLYGGSTNDIGRTINKVITGTGTAMSSATGAGGGGTMGGGGGAASGGGGAR
jgi:uncharacterized membrane protein